MNRIILIAALAAAAAGCAPTRIALKPEFWQDRNVKVGVAVTPLPTAGAHKVGAQGLLDLAINNVAAGSLQAALGRFDARGFEAIRADFVEELSRRGMTGKAIAGPIDPAAFPEFEGKGFERDLRALAAREGVDVVVLLSVRRLGSIRPYYGFIPLGPPKGFFEVQGRMVDLRTNQLVWQTVMNENDASVPAAEPWDRPPAFDSVLEALRTAQANGRSYLRREFFEVSPAL